MKNQLKTILLLGALSALLVGIGGALGPGWLYGSIAMAALLNLGAYFFSDKLVLSIHRARAIEPHEAPWLHVMVEELAGRAGIPKPRLYVIPDAQPNAFATGRNPDHAAVAVTEGILGLLDRRELRGVLAHELAHVKNRDVLVATIAAAISGAVTYIAHALSFAAFFGGGGAGDGDEEGSPAAGLAIALVAPIAATLIQLGVSRSREYLADETAARLTGDPEALARALAKLTRGAELVPGNAAPATASLFIVNPLSGGGSVLQLFSTHPPIQDRISRLMAMKRSSRAAAPRGTPRFIYG
jgi:heat shock protein HtpX